MTGHEEIISAAVPVPAGYFDLLDDIKREIAAARARTALAVNTEMIALYWHIGRHILHRQAGEGWGAKVIDRLSVDLRTANPQVKGLSRANLHYMRAFALAWPDFVQQPVGQIPWGHITVLIDRVKDQQVRDFYVRRIVAEGWSRGFLVDRIRSRLHERVGASAATFERTVPPEERDDVRELARDPWVLDFLDNSVPNTERELESRILANIARFLQEMGAGYAFMGCQYCLLVDGEEYFVDMLFYNVRIRRFVVIELKIGKFKPEYVGKLNFYLSVVDARLRHPEYDGETIGILLVAERSEVTVEFSLNRVGSPMSVGTFATETLPVDVRATLPSQEALAGAMAPVLTEQAGPEGESF
ncbi:PDDEXK nuclease domain-containing protein [Spirillospora sp. NPDC047279]|uniref:PDDEXK nuclease domain-containing protein n=1 Tax=Spirillospora sp. NPDC047279 TaxID=3155478 RepID=UPI0033DE888D